MYKPIYNNDLPNDGAWGYKNNGVLSRDAERIINFNVSTDPIFCLEFPINLLITTNACTGVVSGAIIAPLET